jgi:dolichol-phosphate mannosyltransferase
MTTIDPAVSVVVPVRNEAGNIAPLVTEIAKALSGQWPFEVIYVDDGSSDATAAELEQLMTQHAWLRRVRHSQSCGQSAAVRTGVAAARAPIVVTLDGDGQNDPAFVPALIRALEAGMPRTGLVAGQRVGRKATGFKKFQSRIANAVRGAVLRDVTCFSACQVLTDFTVSCRRWCDARATTSATSTSSIVRAPMACRTMECGTGCGSVFWIWPGSGG